MSPGYMLVPALKDRGALNRYLRRGHALPNSRPIYETLLLPSARVSSARVSSAPLPASPSPSLLVASARVSSAPPLAASPFPSRLVPSPAREGSSPSPQLSGPVVFLLARLRREPGVHHSASRNTDRPTGYQRGSLRYRSADREALMPTTSPV